MGSESRSMKKTVPVPLPEFMAWVALLLCVLCCFPSAQAPWCRTVSYSSQPFPAALRSLGFCTRGPGLVSA